MKKWRWNYDFWSAYYTEQDEPESRFPWRKERDFYITTDTKCKSCDIVHRGNCQITCGLAKYNMTYCEVYRNELEADFNKVCGE